MLERNEMNEVFKKLEKDAKFFAFNVQRKCGMEFEDAKQELFLRCWQVRDQYDNERASVNTFFNNVMRNQAKRLVKNQYQVKKTEMREYSFETLKDKSILFSYINMDEKLITLQLFNQVKNKLKGKSKVVLESLIMGDSKKEIAEDLGITTQGVHNIIKRKIKPLIDLQFSEM